MRALAARRGVDVQMRMIDGALAFPDEAPPENWRELRVGSRQGMVTIRRGAGELAVVAWGNADPAALQIWNTAAWALAEATGGRVATANGLETAAEFAASAGLPPLRDDP